MPLLTEIYAYLHHRKSTKGKAFGVFFQIYLIHCYIGTFVHFQLYYIKLTSSAQYYIYTPFGSTYF